MTRNEARLDPAVCAKQADDEGHIQAAGLLAADLRAAYKGAQLEAVRCRRNGKLEVDFRWPVRFCKDRDWQTCQRLMTRFLDEEGWPVDGIKYSFADFREKPRPSSPSSWRRGRTRWPPVPE